MSFRVAVLVGVTISPAALAHVTFFLLFSTPVREVSRLPALVASVVCCLRLVLDSCLLLLAERDCGIGPAADIVDSILLHQVLGCVRLVMGARQRTSLEETNWLVEFGPGRAGSILVLVVALDDISGLADVVLAVGKLEDVEGLHGDGKMCRHAVS